MPLGDALLGTRVEVREISSAVQKRIIHGYGEVYLGKVSLLVCVLRVHRQTFPVCRWRIQSLSPR